MALDTSDWKRIEELVHQAGGVANTPSNVPDMVRADAMAFHTLGLALLDLNYRIGDALDRLAKADSTTNKPLLITPYGI